MYLFLLLQIIITITTTTTTAITTSTSFLDHHWDANGFTMLSEHATLAERGLIRWANSNGCKFKSSVMKWPVVTQHGRGIIATKDIPPRYCLFLINHKCQFRLSNAPYYIRNIIKACPPTIWYEHHDLPQVALFLMDAKLKGESDYWYPMITILPPILDTPRNSWSNSDLQELQFQQVITDIQDWILFKHKIFDHIMQVNASNSLFTPILRNYTFEMFSWAWTILETRAHGDHSTSSVVLNPLIDLFNHNSKADAAVGVDGEKSIFVSGAVKKGEEIFNNYGKKTNKQFLNYGFAVKDNPNEKIDDFQHDMCGIKKMEMKWGNDDDRIPVSVKFISNRHLMERYMNCSQDIQHELDGLPTSLFYDEHILWGKYTTTNNNTRLTTALAFRISRKKLMNSFQRFCQEMITLLACVNGMGLNKYNYWNNIKFVRLAWGIGKRTVIV
jgi:hypothetical protein